MWFYLLTIAWPTIWPFISFLVANDFMYDFLSEGCGLASKRPTWHRLWQDSVYASQDAFESVSMSTVSRHCCSSHVMSDTPMAPPRERRQLHCSTPLLLPLPLHLELQEVNGALDQTGNFSRTGSQWRWAISLARKDLIPSNCQCPLKLK